jgi:pyrroloquinoline quinone (PQQ) biosynthesis protein C
MQVSTTAELMAEVDRLANAQFETPEVRHLMSIEMTPARARLYTIQRAHYIRNRRDCWAFVQAAVPIDIKKLIWEHEREELYFDPRAGSDHVELANREAAKLGLTPEDIERSGPLPGVQSAFWAWMELAKNRPWLEVFTASAAIERRNSDAVVRGGGMSARLGHNMSRGLRMPLEQLENSAVHMEADIAHGSLLAVVAERYAKTPEACQAILRATRDTYIIDRAYRGAIAEAMEDLE